MASINKHSLDTMIVNDLIKTGDVNFSESDTKAVGCKTYLIENSYYEKDLELRIKNCDSIATILSLEFIDNN